MKNAMKRIMSILLVALLLVSALPLAASASSVDPFADFNPAPEGQTPPSNYTPPAGAGETGETPVTYGVMPLTEGGNATVEWKGGFPAIVINDFTSGKKLAEGSWVVNGGPATLSARQILDEILTKELGFAWTNKYTFTVAKANGAVVTRDVDRQIEDCESLVLGVSPIPDYTITVKVYQTVPNGNSWIKDVRLEGLRTLSYNQLYNCIPPTDSSYAYRLSTNGIRYNNNTVSSGEYGITINPDDLTAYVYVDVVDRNSNAPIVYPVGSTGTGTGSTTTTDGNLPTVTPPTTGGNTTVTPPTNGQILVYVTAGGATQYRYVEYFAGINAQTAFNLAAGSMTGLNGYTNPSYSRNNAAITASTALNSGDVLYVNLRNTGTNTITGGNVYNPYSVYLHIFLNNQIVTPDRTITLSNTALCDDSITMTEVKAYLNANYYTAKDAAKGIEYLGLYESVGNWYGDLINKTLVESIDNIEYRRTQGEIHINVMLRNAQRKGTSSGTPDTSNPKTGDAIFAPIAVLGVSATALATVMFVYNKKRMAR